MLMIDLRFRMYHCIRIRAMSKAVVFYLRVLLAPARMHVCRLFIFGLIGRESGSYSRPLKNGPETSEAITNYYLVSRVARTPFGSKSHHLFLKIGINTVQRISNLRHLRVLNPMTLGGDSMLGEHN
jgi:hypothetical protein